MMFFVRVCLSLYVCIMCYSMGVIRWMSLFIVWLLFFCYVLNRLVVCF